MKTMKYGRLEAIEFKLSVRELMDLLRKTGELPEGFDIDRDAENYTEWPIQLNVKRVTTDPTGDANG
jgi:hypothetical protein